MYLTRLDSRVRACNRMTTYTGCPVAKFADTEASVECAGNDNPRAKISRIALITGLEMEPSGRLCDDLTALVMPPTTSPSFRTFAHPQTATSHSAPSRSSRATRGQVSKQTTPSSMPSRRRRSSASPLTLLTSAPHLPTASQAPRSARRLHGHRSNSALVECRVYAPA